MSDDVEIKLSAHHDLAMLARVGAQHPSRR